jgi:GNAT superfamily N-acetyltransferase
MKTRVISKPSDIDMDLVYAMGHPYWNNGKSLDEYITWSKSFKPPFEGEWYVLYSNGALMSSMLVHRFAKDEFGFGSIATSPAGQGQGFATELIKSQIERLAIEFGPVKVFLYSDIDIRFYERFGFRALPAFSQRYPKSCCMILNDSDEVYISGKRSPPDYF